MALADLLMRFQQQQAQQPDSIYTELGARALASQLPQNLVPDPKARAISNIVNAMIGGGMVGYGQQKQLDARNNTNQRLLQALSGAKSYGDIASKAQEMGMPELAMGAMGEEFQQNIDRRNKELDPEYKFAVKNADRNYLIAAGRLAEERRANQLRAQGNISQIAQQQTKEVRDFTKSLLDTVPKQFNQNQFVNANNKKFLTNLQVLTKELERNGGVVTTKQTRDIVKMNILKFDSSQITETEFDSEKEGYDGTLVGLSNQVASLANQIKGGGSLSEIDEPTLKQLINGLAIYGKIVAKNEQRILDGVIDANLSKANLIGLPVSDSYIGSVKDNLRKVTNGELYDEALGKKGTSIPEIGASVTEDDKIGFLDKLQQGFTVGSIQQAEKNIEKANQGGGRVSVEQMKELLSKKQNNSLFWSLF